MLPKFRTPTHPGEMLLEEFLKPIGISQKAFAKHLGWTYARLNEIINKHRKDNMVIPAEFSRLKIFAGSANRELASEIALHLGTRLGRLQINNRKFEVFLIQTEL